MAAPYADEIRARFGEAVLPPAGLAVNETLRRILSRRSHRRYADRPVPADLVRLLCLAALSASAKSDFQQASIIEVADPARRAVLAAPFPAMPWIGSAPAFLVFCGDARRLERIGGLRGHDAGNAGLEGFFNATVDAALALQTCILAAESLGLGTCPISVLRNEAALVARVLDLPGKVFPVAGLCLGWPSGGDVGDRLEPGHVSLRLPPSLTLHRDRYDDAALAAEIAGYDQAREQRHPTPRDKQRAPERFGYAEAYGWSEDKARQAAQHEGAGFAPWLRGQGFTFD